MRKKSLCCLITSVNESVASAIPMYLQEEPDAMISKLVWAIGRRESRVRMYGSLLPPDLLSFVAESINGDLEIEI